MNRFLLILIGATLFSSLKAQTFLTYIDWDKKSIIKEFKELAEQNKKYEVSMNDSANRLLVHITGYEHIECEFYFDEDGESCNEAYYGYSCGDCFTKHSDEFINDRYYEWKLLEKGKYVSKYKRFESMYVDKTNSEPLCGYIRFQKTNWTKDSYKQQFKK